MNKFNAIDPETKQIVYSHDGPQFKEPFTDEYGNLHWFGYAADEMIAQSAWPADKVVIGLCKEWCAKHNYEIGEGVLYKHRRDDLAMTEFEVIAPLMENA